jgi:hypothetical protein
MLPAISAHAGEADTPASSELHSQEADAAAASIEHTGQHTGQQQDNRTTTVPLVPRTWRIRLAHGIPTARGKSEHALLSTELALHTHLLSWQ